MFKITNKPKNYDDLDRQVGAGFHMVFANGNTISVQFGLSNYCEQKHESTGASIDAEIAIWGADGTWYEFESDTVKGYCTPDEVADWIHFAKTTTIGGPTEL